MTQEEKAKAYDEALEKANALYKTAEPMSGCNVILETLFPELKESEDEKMRKTLIAYLKKFSETDSLEPAEINLKKYIAWLEKQGEERKITHEEICKSYGIPDIGEFSDGYHTFNGLYKQRMILFAVLVKTYKDRAWKSWKHEDGLDCFGGGWFIVGIDTPAGTYTYHYEAKDWDRFDCRILEKAKHWDGHDESDVERLFSLVSNANKDEVIRCLINGMKFYYEDNEEATWGTDKFSMKVKDILAWLEKQGRQKSVWHNEDEEPQRDSLILLIMQSGTPIVAKIIEPNHTFNHGERWAYIDDLLEKQGEHTDKIEPKFHEGDWVVSDKNNVVRIKSIDSNYYVLENTMRFTIDYVDKCWHLWSIQDAKDGDVLYSPCLKLLWIFKSKDTVYCGCNLNYNDGAFSGEGYIERPTDAIPATKKQRDTLMKAIADAGYTFDFEKKELKLLITNGGDFDEKNCEQKHSIDINKMVDDYANSSECGNEEFGKPVPCMIRAYRQGLNDAIGKVVRNPAWSEEDEDFFNDTIAFLEDARDCRQNALDCIDWLKSLKDRYTWKPSDEQITALSDINLTGCISYAGQGQELINLYNDLKKLKG